MMKVHCIQSINFQMFIKVMFYPEYKHRLGADQCECIHYRTTKCIHDTTTYSWGWQHPPHNG